MEMKVTHLLMAVIISIGWGLYTVFIYAWKSGRKPSASIETMRRKIPKYYVFFYFCYAGSKYLNITIPNVTSTPTTIFLGPSFRFLSTTLEQSTPTKITDSMLQDLNIMTMG